MSLLTEKMTITNQRLAGLEYETRQPHLATEANVETGKKARKRTEGAAAADRANRDGDSSSARRVDDDPRSLTSFGKIAEPSLAPEKCIGDALISKGGEAPKPHISPVEMRMLSSTAGGLLPASIAFIVMRTIFPRPLFSSSLREEAKGKTGLTNFN